MLFGYFCLLSNLLLGLSQTITTDYPTLPVLWSAETIEPGAPGSGKGIESYKFVDTPTTENPSAIWSNYTDCQRLIYIPNNYDAKRYLLGCESVNCCWESQDGNQVEFQIPNVHYSNPNKKVDVYWRNANITNFGKTFEADEWSWSWTVNDKLSQDWRAYTLPCEECVNGVQLVQWQSRAMGLEWWPVEFKNYRGYDISTDEGIEFTNNFNVTEICKKNNLLECPSGLHDKYFGNKCCDTCSEGTEKYYSIPIASKDHCGESCIDPNNYRKFKLLEPKLTKADSNTPCLDRGYTYYETEKHGFGPIKIAVDLYQKDQSIKSIEGGRQSECDVAKYLRNAGFPSNTIGTMVCISKYESSWNCGATNKNVDGSTDYGLFEINSYYWCSGDPTSKYNECGTSCSSLMDCQKNTNCAYKVYREQGFNAWYGYQYHKSECDNYPSPVCTENNVINSKSKQVNDLKAPSCGTCGTGYQTCCIGFAIDGYPCDCHLTEGGSGTAGSNCGDCGTAYSACCIGYAADGYPCECDVM